MAESVTPQPSPRDVVLRRLCEDQPEAPFVADVLRLLDENERLRARAALGDTPPNQRYGLGGPTGMAYNQPEGGSGGSAETRAMTPLEEAAALGMRAIAENMAAERAAVEPPQPSENP